MLLERFQPQSLKTRVSLLTLLVFVASFLSLGFYVKGLLREELLLYTGEQQRSALNLLTAEINHGLQARLDALTTIASEVSEQRLADPAALQAFLLQRQFLTGLFNSGLQVWTPRGLLTSLSALTPSTGPTSQTPPEIAQVLQDGTPLVGRIQPHSELNTASLLMAVPLRGPQGTVVGALAGEIRLDQPNFLSQLAAHRYGKSGHFFLIDASQRLIFATSDTPRLLEVLPAAGISPWIDRFVQGFEGTARVVNPHGVEVLVSVRQIPMAGWYTSVTLLPSETFALIDALKNRSRMAVVLLGLLSMLLIWWLLRWQLAPMTTAVRLLDGFVRHNQPPQALPVVRQDEVGQLVGGFNRLFDVLLQQKKVLRDNELLKQAVLNSVTAEIAVLDAQGVIVAANDIWHRAAPRQMPAGASASGAVPARNVVGADVGTNYLAGWQELGTRAESDADVMTVPDGVQAVLDGRLQRFYREYQSPLRPGQPWLSMSVTPLQGQALRGAVVSLENITERVLMDHQVRQLAFYDPLTQLPNRRLVAERLSQQLARARRAQTRLALLFIDLDRFKPINDELGHEVGDWLLQAVARRIQSCIRASDTAGRLGGDEFVVLLPDLQVVDDATLVADKICQALAQEFLTDQGVALSISSSIGVALYPDHADSEKDLLRLGDEAMYRAKKGGRNAVVLSVPATAPKLDDTAAHRSSYVHLRWKAAFASGNPVIDQEHQALFDEANALLDTVARRSQQPQAFAAAFASLLAHAQTHFAHEEAILADCGYAHLAAHAQEHRTLVQRAQALFASTQTDAVSAATEGALIDFVVNELVARHILQGDRAFHASLIPPA